MGTQTYDSRLFFLNIILNEKVLSARSFQGSSEKVPQHYKNVQIRSNFRKNRSKNEIEKLFTLIKFP